MADNEDDTCPLPKVTQFTPDNLAPADRSCDICFGNRAVHWIRIPMVIGSNRAYDPAQAWHGYWRVVCACAWCMRGHGGLVSIASPNGTVVFRCGQWSHWPGRLVIVSGDGCVH